MEMREKILAYCRQKGWPTTVQGTWIRLKACPICGKSARKPFAIHAVEGTARCHYGACNWAGGLTTLQRHFGDLVSSIPTPDRYKQTVVEPPQALGEELNKNLLAKPAVLERFQAFRCFNRDTVTRFKLGFDDEAHAATYPYYVKGKLVSVKYKKPLPNGDKKVWRWKPKDAGDDVTTAHTLFNVDNLKGNETCIVTEGEDDCMILTQLGYKNVVSIPNGSSHVTGTWLDPLESFNDIVVIFDRDKAGEQAAAKFIDAMGKLKCRAAWLPKGIMVPAGPWGKEEFEAKDVTDFIRAGAEDLLRAAIDGCKATKHDLVCHVGDFVEEFREDFFSRGRYRGRTTGFPSWDAIIGGRRLGELTIVSGGTGSGKSKLMENMIVKNAVLNEPMLLGSFELTRNAILRRIAAQLSASLYHLRNQPQEMLLEEFEKACLQLSQLPIYLINVYGKMDVEQFVDCASYAKRRLKVDTVILDHLHFMLRSSSADTERHEIDQTMLRLAEAAKSLELSLFVVCHPSLRKQEINPKYHTNDLRGSSFISQVADNIWFVWREREQGKLQAGRGKALLYCEKSRDEAGQEGSLELDFSIETQSFLDPLGMEVELPPEQDSFSEDQYVEI